MRRGLAAVLLLAAAPAAAQVERFAVVVGNNAGSGGDVPLRYAESDAARVASVLREVGDVRPQDLVLLRGEDADTVRRALIAVNERVRSAGGQTVLLVYYSGHADAEALHLGSSRLELSELEQLVRGSAARFRLLVLDACRSGALTRVKGGTPVPPFDLQLSERVPGEGAVFLTSSSASEDSQESDELRASFFTQALLSGLLGAADTDGDGKVTLREAYAYAYTATLRASSKSWAGTQHPTFQYEFRGQGDLVLTTLHDRKGTRAWVVFPAGRTYLLFQDSAEGPVVGEVGAGDSVRKLSVRAGHYFVRGRAPEVLLEGTVDVPAGATVTVDDAKLERTAYARLVRKGEGSQTSVQGLQAAFEAASALSGTSGPCLGVVAGYAFELRAVTIVPRLAWCGGGFSNSDLSSSTSQLDVEVRTAYVWDLSWVSLEVGLTVGGAWLYQSFTTTGSAPPRSTLALQLTPDVALSRELGERAYLFLELAAATYLYEMQDTSTGQTHFGPSFAVRLTLGAGWRW
ncbi:MAG TPA: caspase family protein [Myxococcaceae bacterium]|nr:caspase family protein [Myxococcaceae bacterium]